MAWDMLKGVEGEGRQPLHDANNDDTEEIEINASTAIDNKVVVVSGPTIELAVLGLYERSVWCDGA